MPSVWARRAEGGQATVEFALGLTLLLLVILGIFDVARAVWHEDTLAFAAREGARYAIVRGSLCATPCVPATRASVQAQVLRFTIGIANASADPMWLGCAPTTAPCASGTDVGQQVRVDVTSVFVPIASRYFLGGALQVTLTGSSTMLIQQ